MPNFMLVSLNARFLLKIDLICLANKLTVGFYTERLKFLDVKYGS